MKAKKIILPLLALMAGLVNTAGAAEEVSSNAALNDELSDLRRRLEAMEVQLASISSRPVATETEKTAKKGRVFSAFDIELYGYLRADLLYNTNRMDDEDAPSYVYPSDHNNSQRFSATAKATRLGMKISGPEVADGKLLGEVKIDFFGSADSQGSVKPRFMKAYVQWNRDTWHVLAGQSDCLALPLGPDQLCYNGIGNSGAPGTRVAQLQVMKDFIFEKDKKLELGVSLNRPYQSGTSAPHVQAIIGYRNKWLCDRENYVALSGLIGKDQSVTATDGDAAYQQNYVRRYTRWAGILSANIPVNELLAFSGSIWTGQNLGYYGGSIGQDYNNDNRNPHSLRSAGGWVQMAINLTKKLVWSTGCGVDVIKSRDVSRYNPADAKLNGQYRDRNQTAYTNLIYHITPEFEIGAEYSFINTRYKGLGNAHDHLVNAELTFNF